MIASLLFGIVVSVAAFSYNSMVLIGLLAVPPIAEKYVNQYGLTLDDAIRLYWKYLTTNPDTTPGGGGCARLSDKGFTISYTYAGQEYELFVPKRFLEKQTIIFHEDDVDIDTHSGSGSGSGYNGLLRAHAGPFNNFLGLPVTPRDFGLNSLSYDLYVPGKGLMRVRVPKDSRIIYDKNTIEYSERIKTGIVLFSDDVEYTDTDGDSDSDSESSEDDETTENSQDSQDDETTEDSQNDESSESEENDPRTDLLRFSVNLRRDSDSGSTNDSVSAQDPSSTDSGSEPEQDLDSDRDLGPGPGPDPDQEDPEETEGQELYSYYKDVVAALDAAEHHPLLPHDE